MRGPGASVLLGRALAEAAARHGCAVSVEERATTAWHSATFSGQRLALALSAPVGDGWGGWLATIGELDVPLPGHLLADLAVTHEADRDGRCHARVDALTVARA